MLKLSYRNKGRSFRTENNQPVKVGKIGFYLFIFIVYFKKQ